MFGFKKVTAAYDLLKKGNSVADPALWKGRQMKSTVVASVLWAVARLAEVLGYPLPLDDEIIDGLAVGIIAVVNLVFALTTSKKVGAADTLLPTKTTE